LKQTLYDCWHLCHCNFFRCKSITIAAFYGWHCWQ